MQFEKFRGILKRLTSRDEERELQVRWQHLPAAGELVTITAGGSGVFIIWRWDTQWLRCGEIACSIRHWNCLLISEFYHRDNGRTPGLVWMAESPAPPDPRVGEVAAGSWERPARACPEADLAEALELVPGKACRPLWCDDPAP